MDTSAAAFLYDKDGKPFAVTETFASFDDADGYASDWPHGVSYWAADLPTDGNLSLIEPVAQQRSPQYWTPPPQKP